LDSLGVIEVVHRNSPVWLNGLDEDMADIEYLDSLVNARVPLSELREK